MKKINIKSNKVIAFSLDALARTAYVRYSTEPVVKTERLNSSVIIDYDKQGEVVGIEIIRLTKAEGIIKEIIRDTSENLSKRVREEIAPFLKPALL